MNAADTLTEEQQIERQSEVQARNDTMLYRAPAPDSDDANVSEIWGVKAESKVVTGAEVPSYLEAGWVKSPLHIKNPPKPEEAAGFAPDRSDLDADLQEARDELEAARQDIATLQSDLKAAEDLVAAESKAKDEALARVAELEAAAKPKLGIKDKPSA